MLNVLRSYNLEALRVKFIIIYLLNVMDIIFTLALIKTGAFIEVNFIMRIMIRSEVLSIGIKILIPLILLLILYIRMKKASEKQLIISNRIINICLIAYALLNVSHIIWSFIYLPLVQG